MSRPEPTPPPSPRPSSHDRRPPPSRAARPERRFRDRYGPWAVVAGAAEGLGAALARGLAQRGLHLWLVDRKDRTLAETAVRLREEYSVDVEIQRVDLSAPTAAPQICAAVGDRPVGLVAYVAAVAPIGPFAERSAATHLAAVQVNCATPVDLVHRLLPPMIARRRGGLVIFSSLAAFQGSARLSTYAASKAFELVWGESLAAELAPNGIDVVVTCPGATRTPAYDASRPRTHPAPVLDPETVAARTLEALGHRTVVIPGVYNRLGRLVLSLIGRRRAIRTVSATTEKMYPDVR